MTAAPATPIRHGAAALLGAAPLVARRRAMADSGLPRSTRQAAARWILAHGPAADHPAAQKVLSGEGQA